MTLKTHFSIADFDIPKEIISNILIYLDSSQLALVQRVCKTFKEIIASKEFWLAKVKNGHLYGVQKTDFKELFFQMEKVHHQLNKSNLASHSFVLPFDHLWVSCGKIYNEYLLVGLNSGELFGWQVETGEPFHFFEESLSKKYFQTYIDSSPISELAFFESAIFGISGFEKQLHIWNMASDELLGLCIDSANDWTKNETIYSITSKNTILIVGLANQIVTEHYESFLLRSPVFSKKVGSAVTALLSLDDSPYFFSGHEDGSINRWAIKEEMFDFVDQTICKEKDLNFGITHLFEDQGILVSCLQQVTAKIIRFWNSATLKLISEVKLDENQNHPYSSLCFLKGHLFFTRKDEMQLHSFNIKKRIFLTHPSIKASKLIYLNKDSFLYSSAESKIVHLIKFNI